MPFRGEERSAFRNGRTIDRPAKRKGLQMFCFSFTSFVYTRLYIMCIVFLFVLLLFVRVYCLIVQPLSLVEYRPIDQFLIDYINPFARNLLLLLILLLLYYYYYYYDYFLFYDDVNWCTRTRRKFKSLMRRYICLREH